MRRLRDIALPLAVAALPIALMTGCGDMTSSTDSGTVESETVDADTVEEPSEDGAGTASGYEEDTFDLFGDDDDELGDGDSDESSDANSTDDEEAAVSGDDTDAASHGEYFEPNAQKIHTALGLSEYGAKGAAETLEKIGIGELTSVQMAPGMSSTLQATDASGRTYILEFDDSGYLYVVRADAIDGDVLFGVME